MKRKTRTALCVVLSVLMLIGIFPAGMGNAFEINPSKPIEKLDFPITEKELSPEKVYTFSPDSDGYYAVITNNNIMYFKEDGRDFFDADALHNYFYRYLRADCVYTVATQDFDDNYMLTVKPAEPTSRLSFDGYLYLDEGTEAEFSLSDNGAGSFLDTVTSTVSTENTEIAAVTLLGSVGSYSVDMNGESGDRIENIAYGAKIKISGIAPGNTSFTITTADGKAFSFRVTVKPSVVLSDDSDRTEQSTYPADYTASYKFTPDETGCYSFLFKTDNESHAVFKNEQGTIIAETVGEYDAYYERNTVYFCIDCEAGKAYRIEVVPELVSQSIVATAGRTTDAEAIRTNLPLPQYFVGETFCLNAKPEPWNSFYGEMKYESSDTDVATVDKNGIVKTVGEGKAVITCIYNEKLEAACTVNVIPENDIFLNDVKTAHFSHKDQNDVFSFIPPEDGFYCIFATDDTVKTAGGENVKGYKFCNINDSNGYVDYCSGEEFYLQMYLTAGKRYFFYLGTALSPETYGELSFDFSVKKLVPSDEMILATEPVFLYENEYYRFNPVFLPKFSIEENITEWSVDDESVLTVENGLIGTVKAGTAIVTAKTESGLTASAQVTVLTPYPLKMNETVSARTMNVRGNSEAKFVFTPEKDGKFEFSCALKSASVINVSDENGADVSAEINFNSDIFTFSCQMKRGKTYRIDMSASEPETEEMGLHVKELLSVESVRVLRMPSKMQYCEGCSGYAVSFRGLILSLTWSNGDVTEVNADIGGLGVNGLNPTLLVNEYLSQGDTVKLKYDNAIVEIPITVVPSPVERLEPVPLSVTENVNGFFVTDFDGNEYFNYDIVSYSPQVTVYYKNGEKQTVSILYNHDDYAFDYSNNQWDEHWEYGKTSYIRVYYLGAACDIPVTVTKNRVQKITLDSCPAREFVFGDCRYGQYDSVGGVYYLYPFGDKDFAEKISFTVFYDDGTTKRYNLSDAQNGMLDGFAVSVENQNYVTRAETEAKFTINYLGFSVPISFNVKPSPVESIKLDFKSNSKETVKGFMPDFIGSTVDIRYVDGSSESVEITEDSLQIVEDGEFVFRTAVDNGFMVFRGVETENKLLLEAEFFGACDSVELTDLTEELPQEVHVDNFVSPEKDFDLRLIYSGNETRSVHLRVVACAIFDDLHDDAYYCCALTEYGYVDYYVQKMQNGSYAIAVLNTFNENIEAKCSHDFNNWVTKIPATVSSVGREERTCKICGETEAREIPKLPVTEIEVGRSDFVKKSNNFVKAVPGITPETLIKATGDNTKLFNADGTPAGKDDKLKTGMKLRLMNGSTVADELEIVVLGDANGDGVVSVSDARTALRNAVGLDGLSNSFLAATQVNRRSNYGVPATVADARSILRAAVNLDNPKDWLTDIA